ncbi:MAG: metal ABC transporter permease [Caulobacteraceae bacterium]|nr:metal ABC transporter permease [Caulobacteraceae bacterium]
MTALPAVALGPTAPLALSSAIAGGLALAFGGAPLGVLLIARRMSLSGDALSHGILPGAAVAFLLAGPDPWALTLGALAAALVVTSLSSLLARTRRLPEDAAFAVIYLTALAAGVVLLARRAGPEMLESLLFGAVSGLDRSGLVLAASAATASLVALALFIRGFVADSLDPGFLRAEGRVGGALHLLFMMLVALNLVAGFRAFGALMTVGLMMIPAAGARFWAQGYAGQAAAAIAISAASGALGVLIAARAGVEPGAVMVLCGGALFVLSGLAGPHGGLLEQLTARGRLTSPERLAGRPRSS